MTSVDEWTRADTGVGASIAAGSQLEKGTWADLVKLMKTRMYKYQDILVLDL